MKKEKLYHKWHDDFSTYKNDTNIYRKIVDVKKYKK